jgi:RNA polymerase sigma factor (sigma-70 family)
MKPRTETATLQLLADNYSRFLAFLERRVGSREVAEDLLQDAFVRGVERADSIRNHESATSWFYRVLRNALTDHYRRRNVEERAHDQIAATAESSDPPVDEEELWQQVCTCVGDLVDTLKPEYARALRQVDLDGLAVRDFANVEGITVNNAGVRLHRAREALKRQVERSCGTCAIHRCLDCSCRTEAATEGGRAAALTRD